MRAGCVNSSALVDYQPKSFRASGSLTRPISTKYVNESPVDHGEKETCCMGLNDHLIPDRAEIRPGSPNATPYFVSLELYKIICNVRRSTGQGFSQILRENVEKIQFDFETGMWSTKGTWLQQSKENHAHPAGLCGHIGCDCYEDECRQL